MFRGFLRIKIDAAANPELSHFSSPTFTWECNLLPGGKFIIQNINFEITDDALLRSSCDFELPKFKLFTELLSDVRQP